MSKFMTLYVNRREHTIRLSGNLNRPYFNSKDVCKALGYHNHLDALQKYVLEYDQCALSEITNHLPWDKRVTLGKTSFTEYEGRFIFVTLSGFHSLIDSCHLPGSKQVEITRDVDEWLKERQKEREIHLL